MLQLTLVLPDGSRSLIPAAWTDLASPSGGRRSPGAVLGSLVDLLHARKIVDSFLRKFDASEEAPSKEERERATSTVPLARRETTEPMGRSRPRDAEKGHRSFVQADREDGSST